MANVTFTIHMNSGDDAMASDPSHESARILKEIADKLESGQDNGVCRDYNGNTIGEWFLSVDE